MGFRDDWFETTVLVLVQLRGQYGAQSSGDPVPQLSALELLSVLGQLAKPLRDAIVDHQKRSEIESPDKVMDTRALTADGIVNPLGSSFAYFGNRISVTDYLAGVAPDKTRRWARKPEIDSAILYAPFTKDEVQALAFLRSAINSYDRALEAAENAIRSVTFVTDRALLSDANAFWNEIRQLCTNLDVLIENPIKYYGERLSEAYAHVKGATKDALQDVAEFAGEAAAEIAADAGNIAGRAGGGFTEGFFANAGVMSLAVAGLVVYLWLT